jgi:four helix bundle protein
MATIERFEDIGAWQKARQLSQLIYTLSNQSGFARDFGLRDQIRCAVISIMSNIAEGYERDSGDKDFRHFLSIAKGSAGEVRSQLYVALDATYITQAQFDDAVRLVVEVSRMLKAFMTYLKPDR